MFRVGHGIDVHKFTRKPDQKELKIGGVKVDYEFALIAHSDGDVLLHAICDALLGAAALGDIGLHFPDTDPAFKNVDSGELLKHVCDLIKLKGYIVENIDATIVAQKPKMAPYIALMKNNIAFLVGIAPDQVNVKATTTEQLGFEGRGEGITCHAVTVIKKQ